MKLIDPVRGVFDEEFSHRRAVLIVEVQRIVPQVVIALAEILRRELSRIVPIGAEVIVDDIEKHADAKSVSTIDKPSEIIGLTVQAGRRVKVDPVIPPPEPTRQIRYGHPFSTRHT